MRRRDTPMPWDRVTIPESCPQCGATAMASHVQRGASMGYAFSFECTVCRYQTMADGDMPPEDVRAVFLATSGTWELIHDTDDEKRPQLARFLVDDLGVERAAAVKLAKSRGATLTTGTRVEMEWLHRRLAAHGLTTDLRRVR
ncbi:MAG: hypothetical protein J0L92_10935 [Deltaproteobacteria bacterium]|nr:hypothetical protein [Deltaproteobacteria bacterium]